MVDFFEPMKFFGKEFEVNVVARVWSDHVEIEQLTYCPQTCEEGVTYPEGHFQWVPVPEAVLNLFPEDWWDALHGVCFAIAMEDPG
ncbi:MAG: hypothetical protein F4Y04_05410 [Chloroflexi bacterium]|nr:hypothetical protein [Chloroflexota bacterium]